ncbi:MAG TPA: outer membrane protein assembly factor BamA [Bryobacteraceae bacterium]|nr:outer membrane protein assembly factor BamA [Bryobacteraceae bacterium]
MRALQRAGAVAAWVCLAAWMAAQTPPAPTPAQPQPAQQTQTPQQPRQQNPFENVPREAPTPPPTAAPQPAPAPVQPVPGQPAAPTPQAPAATGQQYIEAIDITGLRRVPMDTVKALIQSKAGDPYNPDALRRDYRALWNSGRFDDITIQSEPGNVGLIITFAFVERRVIRSIDYVGLKSATVSDVLDFFKERKIGLSVESPYDPNKVQHAAVVLKEFLGEHGHDYATVTPVIEQVPPASLKITFKIDEGPTVKVGNVTVVGNKAFRRDWIVWQMQNLRPVGLPPPSPVFRNFMARSYDVLKLEDDEEHIRQAYMNEGYFKAKIGDVKVQIVRRGGQGFRLPLVLMRLPHIDADISMHIEEGPQYHLRNVYFQGISLFKVPDALMRPLFKMGPGDVFSSDKLKKGMDEMRKLYGMYGFIDMSSDPNPDFIPDSNKVDLTISVDEGKQFFIRRIDFSGNESTRDKVIRRELYLDEGDMFNMNLWNLSILRLNQLGYFQPLKEEDATQVTRNANSDTVDLTLKVQERGKNSIGLNGGVSGIAGSFVGFNYSTNNFLGLGETLSLDTQLGTRQQVISLGFTEPYLMDRPIQTGFNVYLRRFNFDQAREASILSGQNLIPLYEGLGQQNLLNYTQNSKGFSVSAATHLKRSFAQIGLTYGFDNSSIVTQTTAAANYFSFLNFSGINGPNSLQGIKTSHVSLSYSYNTQSDYFFPRTGHLLFFSLDVAGTFLGGNVNTVRPTIEYKYFHPSPIDKNHVLAFHFMASSVSGYGGRVAPPFTRTFIGGETDVRGFQIWGITPIAFIPSSTQIPVLNDNGTNRTQTVISNGQVTQAGVYATVPDYQLITPGGDTQVIASFEYRIPIIENVVTLLPFFDAGIDKVLFSHQLALEADHIAGLNAQFPQAGFVNDVKIIPGTQRPRASTGLELSVRLPVVQAPFRLYFAYNPSTVREYLQPPIVADRALYPNYATFANSVASFGQAIPFFEQRTMFHFTIGKSF